MNHSIYDLDAVRPLWEELEQVGVKSLRTPEEVDEAIGPESGTVLLVINSVCGCAAGGARPGVALALQNVVIPDKLVTVFAGVDREATARAREHLPHYAASSPFVALFQNGKEVFVLERRHIEQMNVQSIADILTRTFNQFCSAPGPSVPREVYERSLREPQCSSKIPLFREAG